MRLIGSACKRFADDDSGVGLEHIEPRSGLLRLPSPDRPRPNAALNTDGALGVRGVIGGVVWVGEEDDWPVADRLSERVEEVLAVLSGRADDLLGDIFVLGATILLFLFGVDGVMLIAEVRLTVKANALCGKGLIGLEDLSADDCSVTEVLLLVSPLSSTSSSVLVLSFLRVPTRGGVTGFAATSMTVDLGRYLGRAVVCEDLGRNDDDRVIRAVEGVVDSAPVTPSSSTEAVDGFIEAEVRLVARVAVLDSPRLSRLDTVDLASPMDRRPTAVMLL